MPEYPLDSGRKEGMLCTTTMSAPFDEDNDLKHLLCARLFQDL
jgi:hypothetical protein